MFVYISIMFLFKDDGMFPVNMPTVVSLPETDDHWTLRLFDKHLFSFRGVKKKKVCVR